jgi:hypothetical protein
MRFSNGVRREECPVKRRICKQIRTVDICSDKEILDRRNMMTMNAYYWESVTRFVSIEIFYKKDGEVDIKN